jgi:CBS domain-containing membrane protein
MVVPTLFSSFLPHRVPVSSPERLRSAIGAGLGIALVGLIGLLAVPHSIAQLLIAPLGALAVLLFAVPSSPLAQPWSIQGGNAIAALVGVTCAWIIPNQSIAAALALGPSIALLMTFRCLHPPSGAMALTAVLGGTPIHDLGYWYVLWPVLAGSAVLLLAAIVYNRLTRKAYPHRTGAPAPVVSGGRGGLGVTIDDLTTAIRERDEVVSVDPADLEEVLQRAEVIAFARRSGGVDAAAVMSPDVASIAPGTSLRIVLKMLRSAGVKALPVIDNARKVVGIVTQTDLLDKADWGPAPTGPGTRWRLPTITSSDRPLRGKAREVMTKDVRCVYSTTPIAHVVQVMVESGHHHLPVVTADGHLAGMVTQSDVVAALFRVNRVELSLSA